MSDLKAAAQQALEYMKSVGKMDMHPEEWAIVGRLEAALAEPQPNTLHGWVFKRNADGSVGIFAPPPRPGESQRTSDCVGPGQRDLNELLGKLADHMAALAEPDDEPTYCPTCGEEDGGTTCGMPDCGLRCGAEPVQEPVYWEVRCTAHPKWMRVDEQQFDEYVANGWEGQRLYTAPPRHHTSK